MSEKENSYVLLTKKLKELESYLTEKDIAIKKDSEKIQHLQTEKDQALTTNELLKGLVKEKETLVEKLKADLDKQSGLVFQIKQEHHTTIQSVSLFFFSFWLIIANQVAFALQVSSICGG